MDDATMAACRPAWRDAAGILALGLVVLAPQLALRDIWGPDETRFAEVAREMVARGDWLVPHLNGEIYAEKPALPFWPAAALRPLFGADAGRVVSLLCALVSLCLICSIGQRLYGRAEGLWAARITATMLLFLGLGSAGILDSILLTAILAAITCGLAALDGRPKWWLGAYAAAAAAVLTKGPIGFAVPALVLLTCALACRRQVGAGGWWHLRGALLMLALIAAWVVPACLRAGEPYARKILLQQTLERVGGSSAIHGEPPYYYLVRWPLFLWPWSLLVPLSIVAELRAARRDRAWRAASPSLWFLAVFVLLSLISGKGERYFLPAVPAAALACAHYLCAARAGALPWPRWHRGLLAATWLSVLALGVLALALAANPGAFVGAFGKDSAAAVLLREVSTPAHAVGAVAFGAGLVATSLLALSWLWRRAGEQRHSRMLVGVVAALALGFAFLALPALNTLKSDRLAVARLRPFLDQAEDLYLFRSEFNGILNLYLGREHIPVLGSDVRDDRALQQAIAQAVERLASPRRVAVATWKTQIERLDPAGRYHVVPPGPHSLRSLVLLLNWRPASLSSTREERR